MYLPEELINLILQYHNPYKTYFSKNIIVYFKNKHVYNTLLKQLKQYCLYDRNGIFIKFRIDAILGSN
jgi:hypothetical protein